MLLAIDSGNTNIVFAVYDDQDNLCHLWRRSTQSHCTTDEYAVWLSQLLQMQGLSFNDFSAVAISNVVPSTRYALEKMCQKFLNCSPIVIGDPNIYLGIGVTVEEPEKVGADRLANTVGATSLYKGPMIVIDFGTATTFDVITEDKAYSGGVIAPGINLSAEALYEAAAQLPQIKIAKTKKVTARNTVDAMTSGLYWGYVGLVEGLVSRLVSEYGQPMTIIATGGLSSLFVENVSCIDKVEPNLTLKGLCEVYKKNKEIYKPYQDKNVA